MDNIDRELFSLLSNEAILMKIKYYPYPLNNSRLKLLNLPLYSITVDYSDLGNLVIIDLIPSDSYRIVSYDDNILIPFGTELFKPSGIKYVEDYLYPHPTDFMLYLSENYAEVNNKLRYLCFITDKLDLRIFKSLKNTKSLDFAVDYMSYAPKLIKKKFIDKIKLQE